MPYDTLADLPDAVKKLPKHAQEIYQAAFNSAWTQYADRGKQREALAHATAWSAVERSYEKKNGRWVAKTKEASQEAKWEGETCNLCGRDQRLAWSVSDSLWEKVASKECQTKVLCLECFLERATSKNIVVNIKDFTFRGNADLVTKAKEAIMTIKIKETELSDENKRHLLQTALTSEYGLGEPSPIPGHVYVEDVFESHLIYNVDGQSYQVDYKLGEDGKTTFGEPEKVVRQTVYKPMESLRETYSEMIQEAGKRNAMKDATRLKKILELCQELMSSEVEPEEKKAKEALKEANTVLGLMREQAVMKTEDGVKFPAAAFAYVPDAEKSTTWKLRIWEDLEKKVTRAQLGRAAAALSPGGFRGQKVAIPSADLAAVKRKIRAEYRKLDVEEEEIPRWVKEVERREEILGYMPLTEATFDKGRATVIVIKAGFNETKDRYYPKEVLQRDYKIFEGQKMYADHPTETEEKERPERSIREWVATLKDVTCDEAGTVTGVADIIESWLMQKLATLRDKQMLSEMGISINAVGSGSKSTIDNVETVVIEKLEFANSVDFVTEPGAGGVVTLYESDRTRNLDLVELVTLKERRPDLVKAIEAEVKAVITKEVKKAMENEEKITELEGQIEDLTKERDGLKEAAEKAEKDKLKAEAQAAIKEAVDKAELPDAAKEVLTKRFENAETADGITEAIQAEIDYIAKLAESGKVKGMGASQVDTEKDREALKESFKRTHPDWTEDQIETAVTGS